MNATTTLRSTDGTTVTVRPRVTETDAGWSVAINGTSVLLCDTRADAHRWAILLAAEPAVVTW
jgi:hypothetical protein